MTNSIFLSNDTINSNLVNSMKTLNRACKKFNIDNSQEEKELSPILCEAVYEYSLINKEVTQVLNEASSTLVEIWDKIQAFAKKVLTIVLKLWKTVSAFIRNTLSKVREYALKGILSQEVQSERVIIKMVRCVDYSQKGVKIPSKTLIAIHVLLDDFIKTFKRITNAKHISKVLSKAEDFLNDSKNTSKESDFLDAVKQSIDTAQNKKTLFNDFKNNLNNTINNIKPMTLDITKGEAQEAYKQLLKELDILENKVNLASDYSAQVVNICQNLPKDYKKRCQEITKKKSSPEIKKIHQIVARQVKIEISLAHYFHSDLLRLFVRYASWLGRDCLMFAVAIS